MKVLVTGGAGYMGSDMVRELLAHDHTVVALDTLEIGAAHALHTLGVADALLTGSVADSAMLDRIFTTYHIDAVIHFAAFKKGSESMTQPAKYFLTNVGGTFTLLDAMVRHNVSSLIFSSSGGIYGNPVHVPVSEEDTDLRPESPYGEGKLMVERALPWYDRAYGLKSVSLRYFNAAGAALDGRIGEDWRFTNNLIPLALKAALGVTDSFTIYGTDYATRDGTAIRDFVHVSDLSRAHLLALDHIQRTQRSNVYNLGTGQGTTVGEVVEAVKRITGCDFPVETKPRRAGDPVAVWADSRKAQHELGWQAHYDLDVMVRSAYKWHASQISLENTAIG